MSQEMALRRHTRSPLDSTVRLGWQDDQGVQRVVKGRCVDISARGIGILLDESVPLRSYLQFRVEGLYFAGSGSVRSVSRRGMKFLVGIEFAGTLRWDGLSAAVTAE